MMKKTGSRKSRWTVPLSIYVQIKGRIRIGPKKSDPDLRTTILVHRHNDYEYEKDGKGFMGCDDEGMSPESADCEGCPDGIHIKRGTEYISFYQKKWKRLSELHICNNL